MKMSCVYYMLNCKNNNNNVMLWHFNTCFFEIFTGEMFNAMFFFFNVNAVVAYIKNNIYGFVYVNMS